VGHPQASVGLHTNRIPVTGVATDGTGKPGRPPLFPSQTRIDQNTRRVIATELNIPANAPGPYCHQAQLALELNGDTLPGLNYVKLELF
jgi:hypothetical protein